MSHRAANADEALGPCCWANFSASVVLVASDSNWLSAVSFQKRSSESDIRSLNVPFQVGDQQAAQSEPRYSL